MTWEFIERVETEDTGGGIINDVVYLKDGTALRISDELICLYRSAEDETNLTGAGQILRYNPETGEAWKQ